MARPRKGNVLLRRLPRSRRRRCRGHRTVSRWPEQNCFEFQAESIVRMSG